jgi:hypothetical protein
MLEKDIAAFMLEMPIQQDQRREFRPVSKKMQGRLAILFRVQNDVEIRSKQCLAE